jgi:hypothetical protein
MVLTRVQMHYLDFLVLSRPGSYHFYQQAVVYCSYFTKYESFEICCLTPDLLEQGTSLSVAILRNC